MDIVPIALLNCKSFSIRKAYRSIPVRRSECLDATVENLSKDINMTGFVVFWGILVEELTRVVPYHKEEKRK